MTSRLTRLRRPGWLEPELWESRFARRLLEMQPQLPPDIAMDTAKLLRAMLSLEDPEEAVLIFLEVMRRSHAAVGEETAEAIKKIQLASRKGSGNA